MDLRSMLEPFVRHWGYVGVLGLVGIECAGFPLPGEIALVSAAAFAATTHELDVWGVVAAGAAGGVVGGGLGYVIGRWGGRRLLAKVGPKIGLNEKRLKVGRYLFERHGGAIVFVGRFIAVLRAYAGLLAGANGMRPGRFALVYAAGSIVWASVYGFGAAGLGKEFERVARPAGIALAVVAAIGLVVTFVVMKRHESELEAKAERAFPGPAGSTR